MYAFSQSAADLAAKLPAAQHERNRPACPEGRERHKLSSNKALISFLRNARACSFSRYFLFYRQQIIVNRLASVVELCLAVRELILNLYKQRFGILLGDILSIIDADKLRFLIYHML